MGPLGCGCAALAAIFALVGLLPLLGWVNWLTTLPAAILAVIFSGVALNRERRSGIATLGLIGGVLVLFWALFRLTIGGGII